MIEVYDLEMNKIGTLSNTWGHEHTLVLNKAGEFSFQAAMSAINIHTLNLERNRNLDQVQHNVFMRYLQGEEYLFTGMVSELEKKEDNGQPVASVRLHGMIQYLNRFNVRKRSYTNASIQSIVRDLLSLQDIVKMGDIELSDILSIDFAYEQLDEALFALQETVGGDFYIDPHSLELNWVRQLGGTGPTIAYQKNMEFITFTSESEDHFTRIIPLGANAGEGENRITIESVNNGVDYLEADTVREYGVIERVWEDERYKHPLTLKLAAERLLEEHKHPSVMYETSMIDLSKWKDEWGRNPFREKTPELGDVVRIDHPGLGLNIEERIVSIRRSYDEDKQHEVKIELGERKRTWADVIKGMKERQNGNRYDRGYYFTSNHPLSVEFDPTKGATQSAQIKFFVDPQVERVNFARLFYSAEEESGGQNLSSTLRITLNGTQVYSGKEYQKELELKGRLTTGNWYTLVFTFTSLTKKTKLDAVLNVQSFYQR